MITFLTSSPTIENCPKFNDANGFIRRLAQHWPANARCLLVAAHPDDHRGNDAMTEYYRDTILSTGLSLDGLDLWDSRYYDFDRVRLASYDVIILSCGHVPTQKKWFESIDIRYRMQDFDGILIGISAGAMISARTVYAWPEAEGKTLDPDYPLFFQGLGYAETMILPHYQSVKDRWLDGKRLIEDVACGDSLGRKFLALPDGSYVIAENGHETVYGEAWLIDDGVFSPYCAMEQSRKLM
ncbi:MAG: Type 1 glutamine amidotransferase-like domain-containing protein [Clostridia bacterium]|nr:Type 1 glutamine amidotransferase-like domain-containing protein [Clostridia bacterium]